MAFGLNSFTARCCGIAVTAVTIAACATAPSRKPRSRTVRELRLVWSSELELALQVEVHSGQQARLDGTICTKEGSPQVAGRLRLQLVRDGFSVELSENYVHDNVLAMRFRGNGLFGDVFAVRPVKEDCYTYQFRLQAPVGGPPMPWTSPTLGAASCAPSPNQLVVAGILACDFKNTTDYPFPAGSYWEKQESDRDETAIQATTVMIKLAAAQAWLGV